jgi:hypothetical protein
MNNDHEDSEELLCYLEFSEFEGQEFINNPNLRNLILNNIMESNPSCNIDQYKFKGTHKINIGSQLFFDTTKPTNTNECCVGSTIKKVDFILSELPEADESHAVNSS